MSIVIAQPDMLGAAAGELQSINAALRAGNAAAAVPTTAVVPAAADLVSALTAAQFARHARLYQEISAQAAAVQEQLATTLGVSGASYAVTEAANASTIG
ncbi:PE family protein [Mycobacterium lacus]|uniref:PE family protein PE32 n=1 Tax=Mycobacterium lacus TaxID=169765 RepID=A0A1X1YT08_9MYCO|nr:PE family protein [Mycobacterium lacus]MCV7124900.1 PE family protein [Mycobacterium lacus]ORW14225.1 PE family protein [Mycobacterium lacus]BBX99381.1 PE family protein PE32 [Mycobacterium lacus]